MHIKLKSCVCKYIVYIITKLKRNQTHLILFNGHFIFSIYHSTINELSIKLSPSKIPVHGINIEESFEYSSPKKKKKH